ncbi:MAG: peptidylprolyl isomerase [Rhizobiales bacterium]|nr:peptidylprolyl isomerase [Hyphomicrobiales bacterium]
MTPLHSCAPIASTVVRVRTGAVALTAAGMLMVLMGIPVLAQDSDPVAARVNGVEVRQSDLAIAEEEFGSNIPGNTSADKRDALISYFTDMILVARAAEAKGMGSTTEFARKLSFAKTKILMETMLQAETKAAVTDTALRKVYDEAVKEMGKEEEVHARHILVETEDEAKIVLAELKKGAEFEKLAKEKSKDPSAATNGGDLGYFAKDQMVPEFADTAFKLPKGQLSDPVKSQFGWHVIRSEDKRMKPVPEFDAVKPQLVQYVVRNAQAAMIAKLREGASIEKMPAPEEKK